MKETPVNIPRRHPDPARPAGRPARLRLPGLQWRGWRQPGPGHRGRPGRRARWPSRSAASTWSSPTRPPCSACSASTSAPARTRACAGTIRSSASRKISLRTRNFESSKLKVNDLDGSPIEIASVVVWQVVDSAEAVYNVDDYESFVHIQSESALRAMATSYPYDQHEDGEISLRSHAAEISKHLTEEIQERLALAGVRRHRSAHQPPGLRAGNRPGHAAAPAGRRDHRRAHAHRRRRGQHGRDGARANCPSATWSTWTRSGARPWSATCWWCCAASAAPSRSSTPARSTDPA